MRGQNPLIRKCTKMGPVAHLNFRMDWTGPNISSCAINMPSWYYNYVSILQTFRKMVCEQGGHRRYTWTFEKTVGLMKNPSLPNLSPPVSRVPPFSTPDLMYLRIFSNWSESIWLEAPTSLYFTAVRGVIVCHDSQNQIQHVLLDFYLLDFQDYMRDHHTELCFSKFKSRHQPWKINL